MVSNISNSDFYSFQIFRPNDLDEVMEIAQSIFNEKNLYPLFPIFQTAILELVFNGFKAYNKRDYFRQNNLDFERDYDAGIESFKKLFHEDQDKDCEKISILPIVLEIETIFNSISLEVTTMAQMHLKEIDSVNKVMENFSDLTDQVSGDGEGGGIGLLMILNMLRNSHLEGKCLSFSSKEGKTTFSLVLPIGAES